MVKLTKIYTRGGDQGDTSLSDGSRRRKDDPRITAYGSVDELNAAVGIARLAAPSVIDDMLAHIQNDLFDLGADLSTPSKDSEDDFKPSDTVLRIADTQIIRLELEIDAVNAGLKTLTSFILPGGTPTAAHLHLARTICRRAERDTITASDQTDINPAAVRYLNRLSDHLFVLARLTNNGGKDDVLWVPGANR